MVLGEIMLNLIFVLILNVSYAQMNKVPCFFPNVAKEDNKIINCATKFNNHILIDKKVLKKISFDNDNLASGTIVNEGCYWLNKKGLLKKTYCFDNGADYFMDGLVRYVDSKNKIGFMNKKLEVVIQPKFTFSFPFEGGLAKACNDCEMIKIENSEHTQVTGGTWFVIDKKGKILKKCIGVREEHQCNLGK